MYPGWVEIIGLILLIWLGILSLYFWKQNKFLSQMFPKDSDLDIKLKFKEVLDSLDEYEKREQALIKHIALVKKEGLEYIQKVAMMRYNPYSDTGGDQSFTIALLNGKDTGFLVTSLHSRAGTRVYTKNITRGKSDIELSKEEKKALEMALNK